MMLSYTLLLLICAPPTTTSQQPELLKTFRKEFVALSPGRDSFPTQFQMGRNDGPASERPSRQVSVKDFAIGKYEVPQNLYQAVMGTNPSRWKGPRNSVEMVSYQDAVSFCQKATQQMRQRKLIEEDEEIRLPSEAEWEYAARAGSTSRYCFGDDVKQLDQYAWHTGNAAGNDPPVGAKKPNRWGLYDMHGYLWEWCADPGHADYRQAPADSRVWQENGDPQSRVVRGGSWKDPATQLTSSCRAGTLRLLEPYQGKRVISFAGGLPAKLKDDALGFRCVLAKVQ